MPGNDEILDELVLLSHRLGDPAREWVIAGEGSASIRLDDSLFTMTSEGADLASLSASELITLSFAPLLDATLGTNDLTMQEVDNAIRKALTDPAGPRPSEEALLHAYLLTLPDVLLVGRTHTESIAGLVCSERGWELLLQGGRLTPEEVVHCGIAPCCVPFAAPGLSLARAAREQVERYLQTYQCSPKTIYLQNQGLIALGGLAGEVERTTAVADKAARIITRALMAGGMPAFLSQESVASLASPRDEAEDESDESSVETISEQEAPAALAPEEDGLLELVTEPDSAGAVAAEPAAETTGDEVQDAVAWFRQVVSQNPSDAGAHYNLGLALLSQGDVEESISVLRLAVTLNPKDADAKVNLGVALAHSQMWDEAVQQLAAALALAPSDASIYYNLGLTYLGMEKGEEAATMLREAVRLDPADAESHTSFGNALFTLGRLDDAIAEFEEAVRLDTNAAEAYALLGSALYEKGVQMQSSEYWQPAQEALTRALQLDQSCTPAREVLGKLAQLSADPEGPAPTERGTKEKGKKSAREAPAGAQTNRKAS